jgi:AcrR family transcriptional regulator
LNNIIKIGDIRKSQILEAALRTFSQVGTYNVTLDDIAEEAGMSKGGIAYYFSSKEGLVKEVFKVFFERIFQRSKETMDQYTDPMDKLLSFSWLYDSNDPDVNHGYQLLFDFMSMAVRDEECRKIYHEWVNNWIVLLKKALIEGIEQGKFRKIDADSTARCISSIYHGIAMRWYLDRDSNPTEWAVKSFTESITRLMGV